MTWIKKVIISLDEGNWFLTTTDILPYSWGMIIIKNTDRQSKKGQIWPFGGSYLTQGLEMGKNKRSINKGKNLMVKLEIGVYSYIKFFIIFSFILFFFLFIVVRFAFCFFVVICKNFKFFLFTVILSYIIILL